MAMLHLGGLYPLVCFGCRSIALLCLTFHCCALCRQVSKFRLDYCSILDTTALCSAVYLTALACQL